MNEIAVLLTCYNRKEKTINCINSLYKCVLPEDTQLSIYLVDDGSTDGTKDAISELFPLINLIHSQGNLFWAGGMRLAWKTAISSYTNYDFFLLLNDDTTLVVDALIILFEDLKNLKTDKVILVGSTINEERTKLTYGGRKLYKRNNPKSYRLVPNNSSPQECDLANANIMLVSIGVVEVIGILSERYTHGIADFDYSMNASNVCIPVLISSKVLGICIDDHGNNWLPSNSSINERIKYLYDVKGLAYHEYLFYIKSHFPSYFYKAKLKLWLKTLFPVIWDKFK